MARHDQRPGCRARRHGGGWYPRDSLYVRDVLDDRDGGRRPETTVTDTASHSDIVCVPLTQAGFTYAPQPADLPDRKMWRIDRAADCGAFQDSARGAGSTWCGSSGTGRTFRGSSTPSTPPQCRPST
nr:Tn3 family transposase [Streptomyces virginiae]